MLLVVGTVHRRQSQNCRLRAAEDLFDENLFVVAAIGVKMLAERRVFAQRRRIGQAVVPAEETIVLTVNIRRTDDHHPLSLKVRRGNAGVRLAHTDHVDDDVAMQIARKIRAIAVDVCAVPAIMAAVKNGDVVTG